MKYWIWVICLIQNFQKNTQLPLPVVYCNNTFRYQKPDFPRVVIARTKKIQSDVKIPHYKPFKDICKEYTVISVIIIIAIIRPQSSTARHTNSMTDCGLMASPNPHQWARSSALLIHLLPATLRRSSH